jgi:Plasmid encoded RepA protein
MNDNPKDPAQLRLGEILTNLPAVRAAKKVNTMSRVHRRLIEPIETDEQHLSFQHTVFCQTSLPYRNPGDDVRLWQRSQGRTFLEIEAGRVLRPVQGTSVPVGLPWGPKPRLILAHLNGEAKRQNSPAIEVESSLSAFVKRIRRFEGGREIRAFKDQLTRISNATFRFSAAFSDGNVQTNAYIIESFHLWPEKDERQRVLWPSIIEFSAKYYESLQEHAVPLNEADLAALAHSALAIDLYCWLAQRLHRVTPLKPVFITWAALKQQFGPDYGRMDNFKRVFRVALRQVRARYQRAIIDLDDRGMTLHHSLPPVTKQQQQVMLPPPAKTGPRA